MLALYAYKDSAFLNFFPSLLTDFQASLIQSIGLQTMDTTAKDMGGVDESCESVISGICRMWPSTICRNVTIYYFEQRDLATSKCG